MKNMQKGEVMAKFTIVYTDGHEEHYNLKVLDSHEGMEAHYMKQVFENDILKLLIEEEQVALIPVANIRKILFLPENDSQKIPKEMPGFLHVNLTD